MTIQQSFDFAAEIKACQARNPRPNLLWFTEQLDDQQDYASCDWMKAPIWWLANQMTNEIRNLQRSLARLYDNNASIDDLQNVKDSVTYCTFITHLIEISQQDSKHIC